MAKRLVLMAILVVAVVHQISSTAARADGSHKDQAVSTDDLFRQASVSTGPVYLGAEKKILWEGVAAATALRSHLHDADEVDRLMAKTLLDWIEGRASDNEPALQYLESLPARISRTAMGTPSPLGAAEYLELKHGKRVADILALRLVKETGWPNWKTGAVLLYLEKAKSPFANAAVIRFAAETKNQDYRDVAITILKDTQDAELPNKLRKESERCRASNRPLPEFLEKLITN